MSTHLEAKTAVEKWLKDNPKAPKKDKELMKDVLAFFKLRLKQLNPPSKTH